MYYAYSIPLLRHEIGSMQMRTLCSWKYERFTTHVLGNTSAGVDIQMHAHEHKHRALTDKFEAHQ
jgi:hypothetical protein